MLHIYAALAQKERALISERTRVALAAKKARGETLGSPRITEVSQRGRAAQRRMAARFASNTMPIIESIIASGITTYRAIAQALNSRGVETARGGAWDANTVKRIIHRTGKRV